MNTSKADETGDRTREEGQRAAVGWRVGRAFRWKPEQACAADDLMRILPKSDGAVFVIASAGECGFSTCWAPGSRIALDLFENAIVMREHAASATLEKGLSDVRAQFVEAAQQADRYFPDDDLGGPHATVTAVACSLSSVSASWIGGDGALLVRNFHATWATTAHDLRTLLRAQDTVVPDDAVLPDIVVRCIANGTDSRPDSAQSTISVGDTLVLANTYLRRRLSDEAIAYLASVSICPQEIAEALTRIAYEGDDVPVTATIVARREDVDFASLMEALIERYAHDGMERERLEDYARRHRILPLGYDMGGAYGFDADGRAVSMEWDDYDKPPQALRHVGLTLWMRQRLADIEPALVFLAPDRSKGTECLQCREWRASVATASDVGCPFCSHLGWLAPEPPPALRTYYGLAKPRASKPRHSKRWWRFWKR